MKLGSVVADNSVDGAYAIEATCHAPDKAACFRQIFNALKPGGVFVGYEWTMTDNYDANDVVHRKIKKDVEEGDGLPDLYMSRDVPVALKQAGFDVISCEDLAVPDTTNSIPWYYDLKSHGGIKNWKLSPTGVALTKVMVRILEAIRLAPKGTVAAHNVLDTARIGLVKGGELGLFTPMLFFKAVKPLTVNATPTTTPTTTTTTTTTTTSS
jgi:sterol 24-C-methyltransferase